MPAYQAVPQRSNSFPGRQQKGVFCCVPGLTLFADKAFTFSPGIGLIGHNVVFQRVKAGLRARDFGWKKISREMGIAVGTLYRLA